MAQTNECLILSGTVENEILLDCSSGRFTALGGPLPDPEPFSNVEVQTAEIAELSSGIWRLVVLQNYTYISKECIAFIFGVEDKEKQVTSKKQLNRISNGIQGVASWKTALLR
jgi:hypothetical protein